MSLFSKIGRGFKKLASFTGKVTKGIASGGLAGGAAAFASNLGGGKATKKSFQGDSNLLSSTNPLASTVSFGGVVLTTEQKEKRKRNIIIASVAAAILFLIAFIFKRKR